MLTGFRRADSHPQVRVIVLTGQGTFFTTGLDLSESMTSIYESEEEPIIPKERLQTLDAYHQLLITTDKILIAAANGPGVGYGLSSIALFDFVYSDPAAYFFAPVVKLGVCAEACSSFTFPRILGRQRASMLLLANERIGAAELRDVGLITHIVASDRLMPEVMQMAEKIIKLPPDSLLANKALLMRAYREELLLANEMKLRLLRERVRSKEAKVSKMR
ncbi:hypothetical protein PV10_01062 [Exophiala mesophila]|uniref:Enoyl-CoA hydratase n=1 Tax=Exophiala mesophila TaxID=212818 RepID=A0A0D1X655_EXOME|nr:uncharacterized protein PV10_01062 [Exophiala mesophila]KIV97295.1 hypothetical protein PV10_01062 [Exophiala mesophila]